MNEHPDRRYIFCTPFLDEIYRIRKACGFGRVCEPKHQPVRKIDDFHSLLNEGKSIATTHSTFLNTSINETAELIAKGDYTLILDECIDAVRMYPGTVIDERGNAYSYGEADIRLLEENGGIEVRGDGSIHVNEKKLKGTRYEDLIEPAAKEKLYIAERESLALVYPPDLLRQFKEVTLLTYMFDGTPMSPYLDSYRLEHHNASVKRDGERFILTGYDEEIDREFRRSLAGRLHICEKESLNKIGEKSFSLSKNWFEKDKARRKIVKNALGNYFSRTLTGARSRDIMWTTFKAFERDLQGKGYTKIKVKKGTDKRPLIKSEQDRLNKQRTCFVPCNARASNDYQERWALAYAANIFTPPFYNQFFADKGVALDTDAYALNALIQWLMRSRLRQGLTAELYLPSGRMRGLLEEFLKAF